MSTSSPPPEVMDEVLNFTAFRIPGTVDVVMDGFSWDVGIGELMERWKDEMMYFSYWI